MPEARRQGISTAFATRPSGALHIINRFDGSPSNPITMAGVDAVLSNDNTGGDRAVTDLMICIGWVEVPSVGTSASNSTWPVAGTTVGKAIELLSVSP